MDSMIPLIDDQTADRLVSGSVPPDDAPPGYARLASLVRAAQADGSASELAGQGAMASMAAAIVVSAATLGSGPNGEAPTSRRNKALSRVLTAKAATAATVALFGLGTAAAAASGALGTGAPAPGSTTAVAISSSSATTTGTALGAMGKGHGTTDSGKPSASASGITAPPTGPANQHALFGLCTAFLSGPPTTIGTAVPHANKYNSTAFRALISEAGGSVESTTAACTAYLQSGNPVSSQTSTPGGSGQAPGPSTEGGSGRPANPGNSGTHASRAAAAGGHGHR